MKKVVILASSRNEQSRVIEMAQRLVKENKNEQHEYVCITPSDYHVLPPSGTREIFTEGEAEEDSCLKDDMNKIKAHILQADLLIIISPVYSHNVPGDLKNIIDRVAHWAHVFKLVAKPIFLIATAESNGSEFVLKYLERVFTAMGATVVLEKSFLLTEREKSEQEFQKIQKKINTVLEKNYLYCPNAIQEKAFQVMKKVIETYPTTHYEYQYWNNNGLFEVTSLEQYYVNIQEKRLNMIQL